MTKLYAVARALGILLAIVAAFVTIPQIALILLLLGAVAAIGNTPDENRGLFLLGLVLIYLLAADKGPVSAVPAIGDYLKSIFGNLGTAVTGGVAMAVVVGVVRRVRADWMPAGA